MSTVLAFLVFVLSTFGWLALEPNRPVSVSPTPRPADSYPEALHRVEELQAEEHARSDLNPQCFSTLLSHGHPTGKVIVFLHGFTSCPEQFKKIGQRFFERGYNVFIPRLPRHGPADRLSAELAYLTAEELIAFATEMIDIARGLGERVTVAGLSGGGTVATWLAQYRPDIQLAVAMAPFLGISYIPTFLTHVATQWLLSKPNSFEWWDPKTKEHNPIVSPYSYPRYATRASGEILRLGLLVRAKAQREKPMVSRIQIITNANDTGVNNNEIRQLASLWGRFGNPTVHLYEFARELGLNHDFITPERLGDQIDRIYQILLDLIAE